MTTDYDEFRASKRIRAQNFGREVSPDEVHPFLFPFQRDVVTWAVRKGRAAVFLETGTGKTYVMLEWARLLGQKTLIVAPLSVARQTVRLAKNVDLDVRYVRHQIEIDDDHQLYITNYEMVHEFDPQTFGAVVLDESSILKALDGHTRKLLTKMFQDTPYRLACTATPAPNDRAEIGNHAEFLSIATTNEMLAMFFVNSNKISEKVAELGDGRSAIVRTKQAGAKGQEWRLKNPAREAFYEWMSSWSISLRTPSDLGYSDDGFALPPLNVKPMWVDVSYKPDDQLFFTGLRGIQDRTKVRRVTLEPRLKIAADLANSNDEQWIVWCGLNPESEAATEAIEGAVEVKGAYTPEYKAELIEGFQDGDHRVLVTKQKIAGYGMNFQNARNMIFLGLSDSFEGFYQAVRREWRFGQTQPVNVYIVLSDVEREIYDNVMQKERMAKEMQAELITRVKAYEIEELQGGRIQSDNGTSTIEMTIPKWLK